MKEKLLLLISIFLFSSCTTNESNFKSRVPISERIIQTEEKNINSEINLDSTKELAIKDEINLNATFFPQAPDADWSEPWQETCEEASTVLAYYYAINKKISKEIFKQEILNLVAWQNDNFGDYKHSNVEQTSMFLSKYFKFNNFKILENPSIEDLKKELSKTNIIIAPFAGKELKNPFYSNGGPIYHMMLIKGYDKENFITNDVGSKRGENFIYKQSSLYSALHDWNEKDIKKGKKRVIVLIPNSQN